MDILMGINQMWVWGYLIVKSHSTQRYKHFIFIHLVIKVSVFYRKSKEKRFHDAYIGDSPL